ncbi:MAG: histidine--tRNA ligase [Clostridia bacterium]|nr:histidine--tRNA ligase [Clostridia bacterium]
MLTKAPRGTNDILPRDVAKWHYVEEVTRRICKNYGFSEIRTPVFEHTELFERGVGDTTDVVQKEMYTFLDKGERSITLRPEGTAGAARAFLEHNLYAEALPSKLFYNISCYRYEKPQAGRLREFHQFGVECYGAKGPAIDAEIISLAGSVLKELKVPELKLNLNSIGCPTCRSKYNAVLREYFANYMDTLCETCKSRYEKNPLRILDCKSPVCKEIGEKAPMLLDYICDECNEHFESVKKYLDASGIEYNIDPTIVRGLDYYTKTVFEFKTQLPGTQGTVCGGGRYDGLIEELGGAPMPGIGFGMGMERIILAMEAAGVMPEFDTAPDLFVATIGEKADVFSMGFINKLREENVSVVRDYLDRSLKAQMKYSDKTGAKYSIVLGDTEIEEGKAKLKNMATGEAVEIELTDVAKVIKESK